MQPKRSVTQRRFVGEGEENVDKSHFPSALTKATKCKTSNSRKSADFVSTLSRKPLLDRRLPAKKTSSSTTGPQHLNSTEPKPSSQQQRKTPSDSSVSSLNHLRKYKAASHDKENSNNSMTKSTGIIGQCDQKIAGSGYLKPKAASTKTSSGALSASFSSQNKKYGAYSRKVSFSPVTRRAITTDNAINSVRRSVRGTISPRFGKTTTSTPKHLAAFHDVTGSPSDCFKENLMASPSPSSIRQPPKTPKSILKEQLEMTMDESLLLSPSVPVLEQHPRQSKESSNLNLDERKNQEGLSTPAPTSRTLDQYNDSASTGPRPQPVEPVSININMKGSIFSGRRDVRSYLKRKKTASFQLQDHDAPMELLKPTNTMMSKPYETPYVTKKTCQQIKQVPFAATPLEQQNNGFCLDLTSMFFNEQKTIRKCNKAKLRKTATGQHDMQLTNTNEKKLFPNEDEWTEMQCEIFAKWLNFNLQPQHEPPSESNTIAISPKRQNDGLGTLVLHQMMAKARVAAKQMFRGNEMTSIRKIIGKELTRGKLAIRADRDLFADLTQRQKITSLLFSYSTPWLRLGLETLFNEAILPEVPSQLSPTKPGNGHPPRTSTHQLRRAMKSFIERRLLSDKAILAKYTHGLCNVPSGNFEKRYRAEIRVTVLKRLLVLFFFLDRAKQANLLDKLPRLFKVSAEVKSSQAVLISFCRDFLAQEGDIIKHLRRIKLELHYKQQAIDEIDFYVSNLAVDLRDGIRLAKITEILTGATPQSLLHQLRIPAGSRLPKIHNIETVIRKLKEWKVPITPDIRAHLLVDGHRSTVLKLTWILISHFCFPFVLDFEQLEKELLALRKMHSRAEHRDTDAALAASENELADNEQKGKCLLLSWCQAVCALYAVEVSDFSCSFADGRALCYLVHHYHPYLLATQEIRPTTKSKNARNIPLEQLLLNERKNSALAHSCMSALGGIPQMMPASDTSIAPDEKSMTIFLCYACSRLLSTRKEIQACLLIQRLWRKFWNRKLMKKKVTAGERIAKSWQQHKARYFANQRAMYSGAVAVIEGFVLSRRDSLLQIRSERLHQEKLCKAAMHIQKIMRRFLARKQVILARFRVVIALNMQRYFRMRQACLKAELLRRVNLASMKIQCFWRGYSCRSDLLIAISSVIILQAIVRGATARKEIKADKQACICVQRIWRGFTAQMQYQIDLMDIIAVQSIARTYLARKQRRKKVKSAMVLQRAIRGKRARSELQRRRSAVEARLRDHHSAIICQSAIRAFLAVRLVSVQRWRFVAATLIQRQWQQQKAKKIFSLRDSSARRLQSCFRMTFALRKYQAYRSSASKIQGWWKETTNAIFQSRLVRVQAFMRMRIATSHVKRKRNALFVLQSALSSWFAKREARKELQHVISSLVTCQSIVRRRLAIMHLKQSVVAAIVLQSNWRSLRSLRLHTRTKESIVTIQKLVRRHACCTHFNFQKQCVTTLQAWWRCLKQRRAFLICIAKVTKVQSLTRGVLARGSFKQKMIIEVTQEQIVAFGGNLAHKVINASILIEKRWRLHHSKVIFQTKKNLATTLAALFRGKKVRCQQKQAQHSVILIQSFARLSLVHAQRRRIYRAATNIQRHWRGHNAICTYRRKKGSVLRIQATGRYYIARRHFERDIKLHSIIHNLVEHGKEVGCSNRVASTCIQSAWRAHRCNLSISLQKIQVIVIQAHARQFLARTRYRMVLRGLIAIQTLIRRNLQLSQYGKLRMGFVILQSVTRRNLAARNFEIIKFANLKLQSMCRKWLARKHFLQRKAQITLKTMSAATRIQTLFRGFMGRSRANVLLILTLQERLKLKSCMLIQRTYRGYRDRLRDKEERAARSIQKTWRCYTVHVDFLIVLLGVIAFQAHARGLIGRRRFAAKKKALVHAQAVCRSYLDRKLARRKLKRVVKLQANLRMFSCFRRFQSASIASLWIQFWWRSILEKRSARLVNQAAIQIQKVWRGYVHSFTFEIIIWSVMTIQRAARSLLDRRRREALEAERRQLLMPLAAMPIQAEVRRFLVQKSMRRVRKGVVALQALERGRKFRVRRSKRLRATADRLERANSNAKKNPQMKLGIRTRTELDVLMTTRSVARMVVALKALESCTKHSYICCAFFAKARASDKMARLYEAYGNQSIPYLEMKKHMLAIWTNIAQYQDLLTYVATPPAAKFLLATMQLFRKKDFGIICRSASLLEKMIRFDEEVHTFCKSHESKKLMVALYDTIKKTNTLLAGNATPLKPSRSGGVSKRPDIVQALRGLRRIIALVQVDD